MRPLLAKVRVAGAEASDLLDQVALRPRRETRR